MQSNLQLAKLTNRAAAFFTAMGVGIAAENIDLLSLEINGTPPKPVVLYSSTDDKISTNTFHPASDINTARIPKTYPVSLSTALTNLANLHQKLYEIKSTISINAPIAVTNCPAMIKKIFVDLDDCARELSKQNELLVNITPTHTLQIDPHKEQILHWNKLFLTYTDNSDPINSKISTGYINSLLNVMAGTWRAWIPTTLQKSDFIGD
jgi:hypothetical protein